MELSGKLDKYDFATLLQMLASSGKSGKLTLSEHAGQGVIVLRQGKIIYAASNTARETLGNMLLCQGVISEEQLQQGLEAQRASPQERRLGAILVELGYLSQQVLEQLIAAQIQTVISQFLSWHAGFFRFEHFELPNQGEVEVDARLLHGKSGDMLLRDGLPPDKVLLELARKMDAARAGEEESAGEEITHGSPAPAAESAPAAAREGGRFDSLRSIMAEFHSPAFTGESTLMILNYGQRLVRRGVLFAMSGDGASGLGQFGVEAPVGSSPDFIRRLTLPSGQRSIFTEVIARNGAFVGPLEDTTANQFLLHNLGGGWPDSVVAAPLIVGGRVLLVFYGDNLPENDPIGPVDELEVVMIHAALAMERNLLALRVEHLEELQRRVNPS
jgi:hypothetical protein